MLYKRRWTATHGVPARAARRPPSTRSRRRRSTRRGSQLLIETDDPNVVRSRKSIEQEPGDERLLPDAVQDSPEPLARPATRSTTLNCGDQPLRQVHGDRPDLLQSARIVMRRSRSAVRLVHAGASRPPPRRRNRRAVAADRPVSGQPDDRAGPQQPARGREVRLARPGAGGAAWPTRWRKNYIEQNLEFKFTASKDASRLAGGAAGRAAEAGRGERTGAAALPRAERCHLARRRQNIIVQKLADLNAAVTRAKTERMQKEAALQPVRSRCRTTAPRSTPFRRSWPTRSSSSRRRSSRDLQRQQAQLAEKLGDRPSRHDQDQVARSRPREAKLQAEIAQGRAGGAQRIPGGAGAGAEPDGRPRPAEDRGAVDEPQGDRLQRAGARRARATGRSTRA